MLITNDLTFTLNFMKDCYYIYFSIYLQNFNYVTNRNFFILNYV